MERKKGMLLEYVMLEYVILEYVFRNIGNIFSV